MRNKTLRNIAQRATAMMLSALTMLPAGLLSQPAKAAEISTTMTKIVVWDWIDDVQSLGQEGLDYHPDNEKKNIFYDDTKYSRILFYYPDGGERYYCNVSPWTGLEDDGQGYDEWSTFHPQQVFLDGESRISNSANREWNDDLIAAETAAIQAGYTGSADGLAMAVLGDLANYSYSQRVSANKSDPKSFVTMGGLRTPYVQYAEKYNKSASTDHTWRLWAAEKDDTCSAFAICLTNDYEDLDVRHTYGGFANIATYDRKTKKDQRIDGWVIDNHFIYANSANHRGEFANAIGPNICLWHWDNDSGAANEALSFSPSGRRFYAPNVPTLVTPPNRYFAFLGKEYKIGQLGADFTVQADQNQTLGRPLYYIPEGKTLTVARDGVLTIDGTLLNDGKIVVEDGGLLVVKDGATIMPMTKYNGNCGAITSYGTVIVENNALLCGGGVNGLKILGGVVVNFGVVAGESLTVSRNYAIDNRATGWVIAGHSPSGSWRTEFIKNAIADRQADFSNPEGYFAKVSTSFDSYYSIPEKGVYGNTANVRLYGDKAVGSPSDPLLTVYTKDDPSKQYTPLFTDEPVDNVSMTVKGNTATYKVGNKEYRVTNKLVSAAIGRGEGKRETIFKDKWVGDIDGAYVTISPSHAPDKSLDLEGGGKSNGTKAQIFTEDKTTDDMWHIVKRGTGNYGNNANSDDNRNYYTIESCHAPGKALDTSGDTANGTQAHLWDVEQGTNINQHWFFTDVGNGYFRIVPKSNVNKNLGCPRGAKDDRTAVVLWDQGGSNSPPNDQVWFFSNLMSEATYSDTISYGTAAEFVPESADSLRLAVDGGSIKTAASGSGAQRWRLEVAGTDNINGEVKTFYTIAEMSTNKVLAISGTGISSGAALIAAAPGGSEMHHWYLNEMTGGEYSQIVARGNTEYVVTAGSTNGAVTISANSNAKTQRWKVNGVVEQGQAVNSSDPLHNQTFTLSPRSAPGMNVGVKDGGVNNGATTELQTASATSTNQQWTIKRLGEANMDGTSRPYYIIENVKSGKPLDSDGGGSGKQPHIWDPNVENANQHWFIVSNGDGSYDIIPRVNSANRLDVSGNSRLAGAAIQVYNSNGGDSQKWLLNVAQEEDNFDGKAFTLAPSHAQNMRLDFASYSSANGTKMVIKTSKVHESQVWKFVKQGTAYVNGKSQSYYTIESCYAEGSALDASGYANGTQPHIWKLGDDNRNRLWFVLPTDDGYYSIVPRYNTTKCLGVSGASSAENSGAVIWDNTYNPDHKWKLTETFAPSSFGTFEVQCVAAPEFSIAAASGDNSADVQLWTTHLDNLTRWKFVKMGTDDHGDYYKIVSQGTERAIDVSGMASNNSQAIIYDFQANAEQFWYVDYLGSDDLGEYYAITLRDNTKMRLGVRGSLYQNGTKIVTTTEKGKNTYFYLTEDQTPVSLGTYEFGGSATQYMRMDVQGRSNDNGGNVLIYYKNNQGEGDNPYQQWKIVRRGFTLRNSVRTAYYTIENVGSGKVLDLSGRGQEAANNLANIQQFDYDGYADQHWYLEVQSDGTVKFCNRANPQVYLDVPADSLDSSVRVSKTGNEALRRWVLHPVAEWKNAGTFLIPGNPLAVEAGIPNTFSEDYQINYVANAQYTITPQHNANQRLDLNGASTENGTHIQSYGQNGSAAQKWVVKPMGIDFFDGDGNGHIYYKISTAQDGNKVLESDGAGYGAVGAGIQCWDFEGAYDNYWYLEPVDGKGSGYNSDTVYNIIERGSLKDGGICLEVPDGGGEGTHLKAAKLASNKKYQQWTLDLAS